MKTLDLLQSNQTIDAQRLDLSCGLTQFPLEILDLAESLEILDLSNNHLKSLPDEFCQLKNLRVVFFNNNEFEEIPEVLSRCPNLSMIGFKANQIRTVADQALPLTTRWLILTDNQIEQLPASMGHLKKLQKLMLAGNRLRSLPDQMAACTHLELVRLAANRLEQLPGWLLTLPRLSWLAYSGNPFCSAGSPVSSPLTNIDWADITLEGTLGQGASGVISKGLWQVGQDSREVAVKVFKGEITSDGLPADEMRACIAAGTHSNLVSVLGKLVNAPEGKAGLVFPFIPADYQNLGNPPSLDSCTRDTYEPGTSFSLAAALRIAGGIAAAAAHLHARGIMHGDLYPHNTLVNEAGDSLLGDFGAASFYDLNDPVRGAALERLEVRAFGCMLEDLLDRCQLTDMAAQAEAFDGLRQLQERCMTPDLSQRPLFSNICRALADIGQTL
ncbi:leucine-rich repeat-containing protein kinase family protein [Pseudanabaena sp. FACHB-2040]|uniref:leucine-rich repeat-containing protein kinase family protein n=1 Tax=Pseudanabaena sp. FACHB-2040 TaxID=2692859 RepID=UPI0016874EF5|nr:leucine-rich repeat-containing protein kinase family protein [Pseudanabaena sp. FACHB-2040]MBD2257003.1 protein kinase [Pseudanabaena sp. FACHB-2040]